MGQKTAAGVRDRLQALDASGLGWEEFSARAVRTITTVVPADTWCVAVADPSTLMMTAITGDLLDDDAARFFELEYATPDYLLQADLVRARPHVGGLDVATEGRPQQSARWRELFEPFGLKDQLRGALVSPTGCWGFFSLARARGERTFQPSEIAAVSGLVRSFAEGLRVSVLSERARRRTTSTDPVLLVLAGDLTVAEASEGADEIFDEMVEIGARPPHEVLAVAVQAKLSATGAKSASRSTTRLGSHGWVRAQAFPLAGGRIAVLVERAHPAEVAELELRAHGLTPREAETTRLVLAGRSTEEVARALFVSPLTVQQHLKSVFVKLDVGSRRELIAKLFFPAPS